MRDSRSALILLGILVILAVLHYLALTHFWYWTLWWFDVLLHILGGFAVGLLVIWGGGTLVGERTHFFYKHIGLIMFGVVLAVGLGWELFEYTAGLFLANHFFPDTIYDLFSDIAGGLLAYVYYYFLKYHSHND